MSQCIPFFYVNKPTQFYFQLPVILLEAKKFFAVPSANRCVKLEKSTNAIKRKTCKLLRAREKNPQEIFQKLANFSLSQEALYVKIYGLMLLIYKYSRIPIAEHVWDDKKSITISETFTWQSQEDAIMSKSGSIHDVRIMEMFILQKRSDMKR